MQDLQNMQMEMLNTSGHMKPLNQLEIPEFLLLLLTRDSRNSVNSNIVQM